jgi:capsular exopolysaccharide synthesis family protein
LSELLSREASETEILSAVQKDERSGLFVLTAGSIPPNPAELLGSNQMIRLISVLSSHFDHVIVDSPPIAAFTDGVLIAAMVEGVLLVIHSGQSSRKVIMRARKLLQGVGARIIGVVLNKTNASSHSDSYYNTYYRGYQYEDGPEVEGQDVGVGA